MIKANKRQNHLREPIMALRDGGDPCLYNPFFQQFMGKLLTTQQIISLHYQIHRRKSLNPFHIVTFRFTHK